MLQNIGIGGIVLSGDVFFFAKIVLVDDLFTAWAVTENIFLAIPRLECIFIFKSSACSLEQCFKTIKKTGPGVIPQKVFY